MVVDRIEVAVPDGRVGVKMAVGFGTLPTRMGMTMMQIVYVPVLVGDGLVRVLENLRVLGRPERGGQHREDQYSDPQRQCRGFDAQVNPELAGNRVEDQPAGVRKRELRREVGRPVHGRR